MVSSVNQTRSASSYGVARAPEFLRDLADHVASIISTRTTLDDLTALELGREAAERIAQVYGGVRIRIPTGSWNGRVSCFRLADRDISIYRMYNGRNWRDVCAAYHISRSTLFRVVRAVHAALHHLNTS
ncbi:MAG TPA: Mor transcription activator family protein [Burkholderiales bacterium]|nr:Mor transcription activator family protein [Burkholderiales bacterium]